MTDAKLDSTERDLITAIESLAATQRALATKGRFPFRHNWTALGQRLGEPRTTSRLRVAGVQNLTGLVETAIRGGSLTTVDIVAAVTSSSGVSITASQVRRASHSLVVAGVVERTRRGHFRMTHGHRPTSTKC